MGTMVSSVKASVALTSTGQLQGYIAGSAANLGPIRIVGINAQASAADLEIKIYDGTSASDLLVAHLKGCSAANESFNYSFGGNGVRCGTSAYVVLANCDHFVAYYG